MTTDKLLNKLPSRIGNHEFSGCYVIFSPEDDIKSLYLHKDGKDWLASYGVEGDFLCMGKLPNGLYDNAFAYGSTPNEALQRLYDWCVKHGFVEQKGGGA